MQDVNDFAARMDQSLILWIAGGLAAIFFFIVIFDAFRRRRRSKHLPPRPNVFKRTSHAVRELRQELRRRNSRKGRRDGR